MTKTRTGGMTAVGVINIVFGTVGILISFLTLITSHALLSRSFFGGQAGQEVFVLLGMALYGLLCAGVGIAAGVAVLKVASWGRLLSLTYAGLFVLSAIFELFLPTDLTPKILRFILSMIYPLILVIMFQKPHWKEVFTSSSQDVA